MQQTGTVGLHVRTVRLGHMPRGAKFRLTAAASVFVLLMTTAVAPRAEISETLVRASGVNLLADNVSGQVARAAAARGGQPPGASLPLLFMQELNNRVSSSVSDSAEAWFTSPPARHLAEVERAAAARASIEELRAIMATLADLPVEDGDLLQRLRSANRGLEINLLIARYGYAVVLAGAGNMSAAEALQQATRDLAPSRQFQADQLRATTTYVYGQAQDAALRDYVTWAESPAGSAWFNAVQLALEAALERWLATAPANATLPASDPVTDQPGAPAASGDQ